MKAKWLMTGGALLGVFLLAQAAKEPVALQTGVGRDVVVFKQGLGVLARICLPGRHDVVVPCGHAEDVDATLTVDVTRSGPPAEGAVEYANCTPAEAKDLAAAGREVDVLVCDRPLAGAWAGLEAVPEGTVAAFSTAGGLRCVVPAGDAGLRELAAGVLAGRPVVVRGRLTGTADGDAVVVMDGLETGVPEPGRNEPPWRVRFLWRGEEVAMLARPGELAVELPCAHEEGAVEGLKLTLREFPVVQLDVGGRLVEAEVADTPTARSYGLQGRPELLPDHGMWFVFERPYHAVFVMKTVSFPLSIAFVREDGAIVNIEQLNPGDLRRALADEPVRFVLEMEQGWFLRHGLGPGSRVRWPEEGGG